jgi:hypothetical protein
LTQSFARLINFVRRAAAAEPLLSRYHPVCCCFHGRTSERPPKALEGGVLGAFE